MNKESIYRIIGYNGEYDASVKKAIRKLLKENHPDNHGDRKIFELINEVKKELEEGRVSTSFRSDKKKIKKDSNIDYDYCSDMLDKYLKERDVCKEELEKKKKELADDVSEYSDYYHDSIDLETYLLSNVFHLDRLKKIKAYSVILLVLAVIVFTVSLLTNNLILLAIFILLTIICVILISRAFYIIQDISNNNRSKIKSYVDVNGKIRRNQNNQKIIKKQIQDLSRKLNDIENNIRFYDNIINNR